MRSVIAFNNMLADTIDGVYHAYAQVPVPIQFQVNPPANPSIADTNLVNMMGGRQGDLYVDELYGRHYHQNYRGRVYHATTAAAGVAIPAQSTTSPVAVLWNPAGNIFNFQLIAAYFGWVSTTAAPSNIGYVFQSGVGSTIATGAPITAFTNVLPNPGFIGAGAVSTAKWAPATCTVTAAGTYLGTNGQSQLTTTGATTGATAWTQVDIFDGTVILAPGTIFYPGTANTAGLSVYDVRLVWAEIPV